MGKEAKRGKCLVSGLTTGEEMVAGAPDKLTKAERIYEQAV